jgi:hypothetical protein
VSWRLTIYADGTGGDSGGVLHAAFLILLLAVFGSDGSTSPIDPDEQLIPPKQTQLWYEDFENGTAGWETLDGTSNHKVWFHPDTLGSDPNSPPRSWWCGSEFESGWKTALGYGNCWRQFLELPPVDLFGATSPRLSFRYRHDLEEASDFALVEGVVQGSWQELARFSGDSEGWVSSTQYDLSSCVSADIVSLRFRVETDPFYSDEDGQYDSDGGFFVDDILIYNPAEDETLFFDHAESLCIATAPVPAGNEWHLVSRRCPAYSDVNSFWCGDDSDTTTVPPNLYNFLISPVIELTGDPSETLCIIGHVEIPYDPGWMHFDADYFFLEVKFEGVTDWFPADEILWANDFGRCDGWFQYCISIGSFPPFGSDFRFRIGLRTSLDGVHDTLAGGAGLFIDDCYVEFHPDAVYGASWGGIKSLFR